MTDHTLIRVLVVDDHTLFRRGVTALLNADKRFEVVAEAGDAGEAYRRAAETQPDIILLDNHLPGVNGVDALPGLREAAPQACVLMLTVSEDESDLAAALRSHGVRAQASIYPGRGHGDTVAALSVPARHRAPALQDIAQFLRSLD